MRIYNLHSLSGDKEGKFALDIDGRRSGMRLIITPLDDDENEIDKGNINDLYKASKIILVWEVSNHYE